MISSFENIASETSLWLRVRYYNLNSLYNKLKPFIKKCFDNDSKYLSDRDFFMMNNMEKPENNVYMPKETIDNKGDVIVPCQISSGTLPSVENTLNVQGTDSYYCSDISISITLDSSTTIAQFSDDVVSGNSDYQYGDQISLILALQFNDTENDVPHTSIVAIEVTLDLSDSRLLSSKSKDNAYLTCFAICSSSLAVKVDNSSTPENLSGVSPVWVHSRLNQSGNILVSTQFMYDCNPYADAHDTALMSYDLDFTKKKFLEPQDVVSELLSSWRISGNSEVHGQEIWSCGELGADGSYHINMDNGERVFDIKLKEPLRSTGTVYDTITFGYDVGLPFGYQKCKYIESHGTEYIDLSFGFDDTDEVEMTVSFTEINKFDKYAVAPITWATDRRFAMGLHGNNSNGNTNYRFCVAYGSTSTGYTFLLPYVTQDMNIHRFIYKNKLFTMDESSFMNVSSISFAGTTANLRLFYGYNAPTKCRIYSYSHIKSNALMTYLVPCLDDNNVPCLYDLVNKLTLYNLGTGTLGYEIDDKPVRFGVVLRKMNTYNLSNATVTLSVTGKTDSNGIYAFSLGALSNAKAPSDNGTKANIICSIYDTVTRYQQYNPSVTSGISMNTSKNINIYDENFNQSDSLSAFTLHILNATLVYELATPYISEIVLVPLIAVSPTDTYKIVESDDLHSVVYSMFTYELSDKQVYGVTWNVDDPNPDVTRIGNMPLHASLPVQSQLRGCLLDDDGNVTKYLNPDDWTSETREGSLGLVMVEIPHFWWKFIDYHKTKTVMFSLEAQQGYKEVWNDKLYCSAYEAALDRTNMKLCSVRNFSTLYRGGNNNSSWDEDEYKSLLGKAVTNINWTDFRTYARNRKSNNTEWNMHTYLVWKVTFWLFVVEYATRNSQKAFDNTLTTEGYHQGGLGVGVTNVSNWNTFNTQNPVVPIGITDTLGNRTGEVSYTLPKDANSNLTVKVSRYRGMENLFGHVFKLIDGIHIIVLSNSDGNESLVYVSYNPEIWIEDSCEGYTYIGNETRTTGNIKDIIFGEDGDIICKENGATSTTYYCNRQLTLILNVTTVRDIMISARAATGVNAGLCYYSSYYNDASFENTFYSIGTRLNFLPK